MTDPLVQAAIFEGHRRLLETFREFRPAALGPCLVSVDLDELRATAAFLRQEVLPFSRWEEEALEDDLEGWEAAAFDHAFLTVEIDCLSSEVAELQRVVENGAPDEERAEVLTRLLRRSHRIEAVLELHLQRAEDRGIFVAPPGGGEPEPRDGGRDR